MEQAGLNQPTPSAGSTHQRFRAGRPLLNAAYARSTFVGNNLADVGKIIPVSDSAIASFADRFNIFANAFDGVAGRSQQGSRKQDDRCKFAHAILHHSRLIEQTQR
jgi:hypothetical protein